MRKYISLIKALMSEGMNLFRISGKKQSNASRVGLPIVIAIIVLMSVGTYAEMMMEPLEETGMEFVVLTLFVVFAALFTLIEGIYKSSGLLFNCRDDNMIFSLPIKKSTVLFVRILKFYIFEVMVNALILLPAMIVYAMKVNVDLTFYLTSFFALLVLPMLPVAISCFFGGLITFFSVKFRFKNIAQIIFTTIVLLFVMYLSFNIQDILKVLAANATNVNETITKLYFPAGEYVGLVLDYKFLDLIKFLCFNVGIFGILVILIGSVYFKINSRVKVVKNDVKKKKIKIRTKSALVALIKKEANRFVNSPVFVINAGFGLVLFVVACVLICIKIQDAPSILNGMEVEISIEQIVKYIPVILFGLVFFASMMSSITSSMISLEGKSFNVLKSLPVKPMMIIMAKVLTAVLIMIPFIILGDLLMFIKFDFSIWQIIMLIASSVIWPMVAEMLGIIVNLKYPKMDAKNDTEVVKQSMSSMVAVFIGMGVTALMFYILYIAMKNGIGVTETILMGTVFGVMVLVGLFVYLVYKGTKEFNTINV